MKDCPTEEEMSAYIDDELDSARLADIAAHLRECERCAGCAREFSAVTRAFREHGVPAPPDEADVEALWERVRGTSGVPHAKPMATVRRRFTRVLVAAAAAAIFAAIVLWPPPLGDNDHGNDTSLQTEIALEVEVYDDSAVVILAPDNDENVVLCFMSSDDEVENGGAG